MRFMLKMQKTIQKSVSCQGIGVHSGQPVSLTLAPLPKNSGIIVERTDIAENNRIPVQWDHVVDTRFCTVLSNQHGVTISTVEHLMAALAVCGITNVLIKVDSPEMPIMDGSSLAFMNMLAEAGIKQQNVAARTIKILKTVEIQEGNRTVRLEPSNGFEVDFEIDFQNRQGLKPQHHTYHGGMEEFAEEISEARSFGFFEDAQKLYALNLAKGSSLENAVVIHRGKVMNAEGLRYTNEMVRHKILDAIGDLYLAGFALECRYFGFNAGHEFNNKILHSLFADPTAWAFKDELESQKIAVNQRGTIGVFVPQLRPHSAVAF
jgi:UDP-3-O-[3-hydroxymyristoyl] N-acetylglucosamine deacetylase